VWLGGEDGVAALDPTTDRPAPVPAPAALAGRLIWALRCDQRGRLWAGTDSDGLLCVDPDSGAIQAHLTLARHVSVLCLEGERRLWAAFSGYGVVCLDIDTGAVLHRVGVAEGLPGADVQAVQLDAAGQLWIGTWGGWLARINPERGAVTDTRHLGDDGTPRPVSDLSLDASGLLWVSTYGGGLLCLDPARDGGTIVRALTVADGLPSDLLYACLVDPRRHIWLGTRHGVARYTLATGRCLTLGRSLGLPSEECNGHALCLDQRGHLWVGTVGSVGVVAAEKIAADVPPCPVHLTGLTVMGREREPAPDLEIEDSDYDLVFSYGAVTFTAAPQVVYRAQLVGLEEAWSPPTPQRVARYTNLRPGDYTFRVAARNWGGQWSAPVEASFRVVRNRQAQEMEVALERERIDKEVALATAAVFERLALQDGLTGLLNRRALDERLAQEVERARRHGHPLTVALGDIDHFKRINDTFGHQVGDEVLKAVARLCQATARGGDSVGRYGGEEIALLLPETTATEGVAVCERLRRAIAGHDWASLAPGLRVTISIGLSDRPDTPHPAALLADADAHLYRAKQSGRNRTCCANSSVHARLS